MDTIEDFVSRKRKCEENSNDKDFLNGPEMEELEVEVSGLINSVYDNSSPSTSDTNNTSGYEYLPTILDGEMFTVVENNEGHVRAKCSICPNKIVKGSLTSTGNFISHIKRCHPHLEERMLIKRREKIRSTTCTDDTKLHAPFISQKKGRTSVSQAEIVNAIMDYLVDAMLPLSTVEQNEFKTLVKRLAGGTLVTPTEEYVRCMLEQQNYMVMLQKMRTLLESQQYICTTADLWRLRTKSYLGVTAHFILPDDLERQSLVLAYRRLRCELSSDNIVDAIYKINEEFGITEKVIQIVTCNFKKYLHKLDDDTTSVAFQESSTMENEEDSDVEEEDNSVELVEFTVTSHCNLQNGSESKKSLQQSDLFAMCSSNKLNQMAAQAILQVNDDSFNKIYASAFSKARLLWRKLDRSSKLSTEAEKICGSTFFTPKEPGLISLYNSTAFLIKHKNIVNELCTVIKVPEFKLMELNFIQEWTEIMGPFVKMIDTLKGDQQNFLGSVLPAVRVLIKKLDQLSNSKLQFSAPLLTILTSVTDKYFKDMLQADSTESLNYVIASISHPRFKLKWVPEKLKDSLKSKFIDLCKETSKQAGFNNKPTGDSNDSKADDFFADLDSGAEGEEDLVKEPMNEGVIEALNFLGDKAQDLKMLYRYPTVKEVFLKFNTILASSAPVENIFTQGHRIITPQCIHLTDRIFEMLLLLKHNRSVVDK